MQKKYFTSNTLTRYLKDVKESEQLTLKEEIEIYNNILNGNEKAKEILITTNTKYVIEQCRKYAYDNDMFDDLFSEGMLGLVNATNTFDYNKKIKFLTYANFHIKQRIIDYLREKSRIVRLPVTYVNKVNDLLKENNENEFTVSTYEYDINQTTTISLSSNGEMEDYITHEYIEDDYDNEIDLIFNEINKKLKYLSNEELYVIEHFFGINDKEKLTLGDIAKNLGTHIEQLSLIKLNALRKIRCTLKDNNICLDI